MGTLDALRRRARRLARPPKADPLAAFREDPAELMVRAGFPPDPWQAQLLRAPLCDAQLLCARQTGKSTGTSFLATRTALLSGNTTTLIVSPAQRQSGEMLRKVVRAMNALGRPVRVTAESATALVLANGSRVLSLPASESTIRGYSADLLIVDEAARVPDDLLAGIRPMLAATGGKFVALSSAFARSGWFYDMWQEQGGARLKLSVKASECPRISAEFLKEERRVLGDRWYEMEYENVFGDAVQAVFSTDDIRRAVNADVCGLFEQAGGLPERDGAVKPLFGVG